MKNLARLLLLIALLIPAQSDARVRGSAPTTAQNLSRVVLNFDKAFLNLSKGWGLLFRPDNCAAGTGCSNANGYPTATPTTGQTVNPANPAGYYGTITWSYSGNAAFKDNTGNPAIFTSISPQGAVVEMGNVSSGDHAPSTYSFTCASGASCGGTGTNTTVANLNVVFQYGWNIQSISNNGSGVIRINTKTNYVASSCRGTSGTADNGAVGPLVNITGAVANTGANATWAITNCLASSFDLVGSTFTNAQAGVQGAAVFAGNNLSIQTLAQGTWSSFSNLVVAKTSDLAAIAAGHLVDSTLVAQWQALMNPNGTCAANNDCGWARFMDYNGGQFNFETDFTRRIPTTAISYDQFTWVPPDFWVGSISNGGAGGGFTDNYTAANPAGSPSSGGYVDGETVIGYVASTNSGVAPSLGLTGRTGTAPILYRFANWPSPWILVTAPAASAGLTMQFTFSATWLNGGTPYVFSYATTATGHFGNDLSSASTLGANIDWAIGQDAVLAAGLVRNGNTSGSGFAGSAIWPRTPQAGALTLTYTSGPAIAFVGTYPASQLPSGSTNLRVFTYNYLMKAWFVRSTFDAPVSPPMEVAYDLCNQVGCNVYWVFTLNSSSYVQGVTQLMANNLNSGLRFGFEVGNEDWNCFGPQPCPTFQTLGNSLGISSTSNSSNFNYACLRTAQYNAIASAAWTGAGRPASDFYTFIMAQAANESVGGNFDVAQLKCSNVGTANTLVANYGAVGGGTVATDYSAVGNRAIDASPVGIGIAPYWGSPWWGTVGTAINGTVAVNQPWLQAQLDYANGSTAAAFTAIANTFNGTTPRSGGGSAGQLMFNTGVGSQNITIMMTSMEAIAASYDSYRLGAGKQKIARIDYEAGPQWAFGTNSVNGTNSATDSASLTALTSRFSALGWDVSPYVLSGISTDYAMLAQQTLNFSQAWKYNSSYANLIIGSYYQNMKTISSGREVHPAQYTYQANTWALFPGPFHYNNQYQNFNAISTWNAGN